MRVKAWSTALSLLVVLISVVPANAASGTAATSARCVQDTKDKVVVGFTQGKNCVVLEIVTTSTQTTEETGDVGTNGAVRRKTACESTSLTAHSTFGDTLLWLVRTCETFRFDGGDVVDFNNPPTVTLENHSPCWSSAPIAAGAHWTDDDTYQAVAFGQTQMFCPSTGLLPNMPWAEATTYNIRHDIEMRGDGGTR